MKIYTLFKMNKVKEYDADIKSYTRGTDQKVRKEYFSQHNTADDNSHIYNNEMAKIDSLLQVAKSTLTKKEYKLLKNFLETRAKLWHELRTKGVHFSQEKLLLLATLERVSLERDNRGIIELGRLNAELGLIKDSAEKIFPEYDRIYKQIELHNSLKQAEITEISAQKRKSYEDYLRKVKVIRATGHGSLATNSAGRLSLSCRDKKQQKVK